MRLEGFNGNSEHFYLTIRGVLNCSCHLPLATSRHDPAPLFNQPGNSPAKIKFQAISRKHDIASLAALDSIIQYTCYVLYWLDDYSHSWEWNWT